SGGRRAGCARAAPCDSCRHTWVRRRAACPRIIGDDDTKELNMVADADAEERGPGPAPARGIAGDLTRESWQRPWYSQVTAYLLWVLVTVPAVWICDWLLPGFHTDRPWGPVVFAIVLGAVGVLVQPVLVGAAVRLGWAGVFLLTLVGQALVVMLTS